MKDIRVSIWGFGAMGTGMARMLLSKKGVVITGVCDLNPNYDGKSIYEVLQLTKPSDVTDTLIHNDVDKVIYENSCDICLIATDSFTKGVYEKLEKVLSNKINAISTAEEMAYPQAKEPELAKKIDDLARANGVSVLGTGINPGLMMDLLAICLTGAMSEVSLVECNRINSLSPFGPAVMEEQGVGISLDEFNTRVGANDLAGHVGFEESIAMINDAIGFSVNEVKTQMDSIITTIDRQSPHAFVKANHVAGVNMTGQGFENGKLKINLIHPQQIEPELEGVNTGDYITLKGNPEINMTIKPEVDGGVGTIAMCVNMIPHVINARAGMKTMLDLPVPRAIMGDMSSLIEE